MSDLMEVTGMVLKAVPVLENDKRVILLTAERGKITAFAHGAKRPTSRLMAATNPLCMGKFKVFPGKNAYTLSEASVTEYFESLREDFEGAMYGMYFADVADYYCRENNDERQILNLLYVSLKALQKQRLPYKLVQYLYEMKMLVLQGEFPGITNQRQILPATAKTIAHCMNAPLERLYGIEVSEEVIRELAGECEIYRRDFIGHHFKSLDILRDSLM
ncbi:MAG: DNA repair protein RecO [Lachnospiraceae bacterium]|nr:DNA repair protein RecO [Lachnospiraceae bacterium]